MTGSGGEGRKGARLRGSWGGIVVPVAVLAAISAFETARVTDASREVFFNIKTPWLMYFVFTVSMAVIFGALLQRMRIWRLGKPHRVNQSLSARITNLLTLGAGTSRVKNDRYAGVMHGLIYSSFIVLTIVTLLLAIDDYAPIVLGMDKEHLFLTGGTYLVYSLVGDVFGVLGLIGIGMAVYRRYVSPPKKLNWDRRGTEDAIIVGLLGFVLFSGIIVEGLRLAGDEIPAGNESWSKWSPAGYLVAKALGGVPPDTLLDFHVGCVWLRWWSMLRSTSCLWSSGAGESKGLCVQRWSRRWLQPCLPCRWLFGNLNGPLMPRCSAVWFGLECRQFLQH